MQQQIPVARPLAAVVGGALVALATVVPGAAQTNALSPIVVTTNTAAQALPFFYAYKHGLFAKAGLPVKLQLSTTGSQVEIAVVGGAAQIGFTNSLTMTNAINKGIPIEAVAPGEEYDAGNPDVRIMTLQGSGVKTAADLNGKILAVPGLHDEASISTLNWLDQHGGDSHSVQRVEVPPPAMYAALRQHRVAAIVDYDPFAAEIVANGDVATLGYPLSAVAPHFLTTVWIAKRSWVAGHPQEAAAFSRVMSDAAAYCTANFKDLIPFISSYSKLPVTALRTMAPESYPSGLEAAQLQPVIDVASKYENFSAFPASRAVATLPQNPSAGR